MCSDVVASAAGTEPVPQLCGWILNSHKLTLFQRLKLAAVLVEICTAGLCSRTSFLSENFPVYWLIDYGK